MTKLRPSVIDLPAMIAARILALSYVDEADEARKRVLNASDDEALHDFRVAVRRVRSCMRAYRPQLDDTVKRRQRRWLRRIMRSTNETRDLEVQLEWLGRRRTMAPDEAEGAARLGVRLKERMWGARAEALRAIRHDFPARRDEVRDALSRYTGVIDGAQASPPTCGVVAGGIVLTLAGQLEAQITEVRSAESIAEAHQARITVKRLRYVLEPLQHDLTAGRMLVQKLKKLQEALGDLNDRAVLGASVRAEFHAVETEEPTSPELPSLSALLARIEADRGARFERLVKRWQERDAKPLLEQLRGAAEELRAHHPFEGVEIERKFLLRAMPRLPPGAPVLRVDQGWLPGDLLLERIRRVRTDSETRWYRTVKSGTGVTRREIEEETTEPVFRALWRLTRGRRVSKRRYCVAEGDLTWEIDRFTGGKLVLAEVELPSPSMPVEPPEWLRKYIVREVTGEAKYLNINLAT
jgi:CHAD domain-containing protein/CYTH domain-containing protein